MDHKKVPIFAPAGKGCQQKQTQWFSSDSATLATRKNLQTVCNRLQLTFERTTSHVLSPAVVRCVRNQNSTMSGAASLVLSTSRSKPKLNLAGVFPPIATSFVRRSRDRPRYDITCESSEAERTELDLEGLRANVRRWCKKPLAGLVVLGSNGEAALLSVSPAHLFAMRLRLGLKSNPCDYSYACRKAKSLL